MRLMQGCARASRSVGSTGDEGWQRRGVAGSGVMRLLQSHAAALPYVGRCYARKFARDALSFVCFAPRAGGCGGAVCVAGWLWRLALCEWHAVTKALPYGDAAEADASGGLLALPQPGWGLCGGGAEWVGERGGEWV